MKTVSRKYTNSSSFKMATLFTILLGMAALLLGYFLYDFGAQNFTRETEALIDREMEHILSVIGDRDRDQVAAYIAAQSERSSHPVYLFYDSAGKIMAGNVSKLPEHIGVIKEGVLSFLVEIDGVSRRVASKVHTFADGSRLLIARDIHLITESYEKLKWITGFIMFFMLMVVLVSFFISVFVVGRINTIALTAQKIMDTGDLSQRISVDTRWDDLSNLAYILNALLDRIEYLMEGIRDVSDSIAHDLRTPLTRLRNDLEKVREESLTPDEADRLLGEADQLLATFNSLLRISNIEKGKRHQAFASVDMRTILDDVVELYDTLAEEKQVAIETEFGSVSEISGDRDLLFQLFANLIDNAIKFSKSGGAVHVSLQSKSDAIAVTIADEGAGISEAERHRVFDRFYRSDASRNSPGVGLGLSLVKAIADYHKAKISLEDNAPGLRVVVVF